MGFIHLGILHAALIVAESVNYSIQKQIDKPDSYPFLLAAEHRKHALGIGFQVYCGKGFLTFSWITGKSNPLHAVNAVGSHVLCIIIKSQQIVPIPMGISKYSNNIIFCFFPENAFLSPPSLRINGTDERIGLLTDADLNVIGITPDESGVVFDFIFGDVTERFVCNAMGEYASSTNQFLCRDGIHATTLAEYFTENPLLFKAADDTVYSGHEVLKGNIIFEGFDQNRVVAFDWDEPNADITKEAKGAPKGKVTIQEAIKEHLLQDEQYSHIFFDHGTGEIADFLTFKPDGSFIKVELYHCKAMKGKQYNSSVEDVYEVAQQAVKSTVWIKSKTALLTKIQARIKGSRTSIFLRGDLKTLKALLQSQKAMETMIYIVQPAVSKETTMNEPFGKVLSAAAFYIRHTGRAKKLKIIGTK